jgi:hypothetical protein
MSNDQHADDIERMVAQLRYERSPQGRAAIKLAAQREQELATRQSRVSEQQRRHREQSEKEAAERAQRRRLEEAEASEHGDIIRKVRNFYRWTLAYGVQPPSGGILASCLLRPKSWLLLDDGEEESVWNESTGRSGGYVAFEYVSTYGAGGEWITTITPRRLELFANGVLKTKSGVIAVRFTATGSKSSAASLPDVLTSPDRYTLLPGRSMLPHLKRRIAEYVADTPHKWIDG